MHPEMVPQSEGGMENVGEDTHSIWSLVLLEYLIMGWFGLYSIDIQLVIKNIKIIRWLYTFITITIIH